MPLLSFLFIAYSRNFFKTIITKNYGVILEIFPYSINVLIFFFIRIIKELFMTVSTVEC